MQIIEIPSLLQDRVKDVKGALVVSGSRSQINSEWWVRDYVIPAVLKRDWMVIVGDARGVDESVVAELNRAGVRYICFGCAMIGEIRIKDRDVKEDFLVAGGANKRHCFIVRDEFIAKFAATFPAAGFMGLWDGDNEHSGTQKTARFCEQNGIPGILYRYCTHPGVSMPSQLRGETWDSPIKLEVERRWQALTRIG